MSDGLVNVSNGLANVSDGLRNVSNGLKYVYMDIGNLSDCFGNVSVGLRNRHNRPDERTLLYPLIQIVTLEIEFFLSF